MFLATNVSSVIANGLTPILGHLMGLVLLVLRKKLSLLEGQRESGVLLQPLKNDLIRRLSKALFLEDTILLSAGHLTQLLNSIYRRT